MYAQLVSAEGMKKPEEMSPEERASLDTKARTLGVSAGERVIFSIRESGSSET